MLQKLNLSGGKTPDFFIPSQEQCEHIKEIVENGEECEYNMVSCKRHYGFLLMLEQKNVPLTSAVYGELTIDFITTSRVIVKRVMLNKRHKGTFTELMKYLYTIIHDTPITVIEMQSVMTAEMVAWCRKYGFQLKKWECFDEEGRFGSYICDAQNNKFLE